VCLKSTYGDGIVIPKKGTIMIEGEGRFINRPTKTGKGVYDKFFLYIPTEVARDGLFPFKEGDEVLVKIDAKLKRVIITPVKKGSGCNIT